jgi:hypothetical protein
LRWRSRKPRVEGSGSATRTAFAIRATLPAHLRGS